MGASTMTVDVTWMRCLDKRDHVIPEETEVLGAGYLKALCDTRIYPLGVSGPRRRCRTCLKAVRAESDSPPQRIPKQKTRSPVVSDMPAPLTVTSPAFPSSPRGRPYESGTPTEPIPQRARQGFHSLPHRSKPPWTAGAPNGR
jgi:hypothetical protein